MHRWFFTRGKGFYGLMTWLFRRWDKKPGVLGRLALVTETASKRLIYGCRECGDCSLPDCAYLCPRHACSKSSRNGPCGGSVGGRCELLDKDCFWARVYQRMKYYGESEQMLDGPVVFYNASLQNTSSWANTYLDRDHHASPHLRVRFAYGRQHAVCEHGPAPRIPEPIPMSTASHRTSRTSRSPGRRRCFPSRRLPSGSASARTTWNTTASTRPRSRWTCTSGWTTRPTGKLVLVTAITPTPAGEGKTTTSIGLCDAPEPHRQAGHASASASRRWARASA